MVKEKSELADVQILHSQVAALEQLIEVYENSVVEQADKLYREIAERRRAEEEIKELLLQNRMILESAGEGIYGLDPDGKTTFANAAAAKMIGYQPEELLGKLQHAILHHTRPDGTPYPREECLIYASLRTGTTHHVDDEVFWKKDGTSFPVEYTSTPIWKDGELTGAVVVFKDITDRREAEQKIRQLNQQLERKVEERTRQLLAAREDLLRREKLSVLGQLSGSIGHELRNPLGVMSNAVYFLKTVQGDADETVREYLGIIEDEIKNSQRIITDLLDFARTRAPQKLVVTADELVRQSLARCTTPDNVTATVDIAENLPKIEVDPMQMVQVLVNFITNGVQAMHEGGALRVGARLVPGKEPASGRREAENCPLADGVAAVPDPQTEDFVEISVADSGEGIPPEHMERLFQPLFTTKPKGIGLGLGGRIEVESEPGKGTRFSVLLPVCQAGGSKGPAQATGV